MRYKIILQSKDNYFPNGFDDILASVVYNKLSKISNEFFNDFKYYNFSYFDFDDYYTLTDGSYYSRDCRLYFVVSSINDDFLRVFLSFLIIDGIEFDDDVLVVVAFEKINDPILNENQMLFVTTSPIQVDSSSSQYDLLQYLADLLISNYSTCYNLYSPDLFLDIYIEDCEKYNFSNQQGNYDFYYMNLVLVGSPELIKFAWDVGLGEFNYKGSGMLDVRYE